MYYTIEEESRSISSSDGEAIYKRNEIVIKDCTDEELNEIRKMITRLYDAYVERRKLDPRE